MPPAWGADFSLGVSPVPMPKLWVPAPGLGESFPREEGAVEPHPCKASALSSGTGLCLHSLPSALCLLLALRMLGSAALEFLCQSPSRAPLSQPRLPCHSLGGISLAQPGSMRRAPDPYPRAPQDPQTLPASLPPGQRLPQACSSQGMAPPSGQSQKPSGTLFPQSWGSASCPPSIPMASTQA